MRENVTRLLFKKGDKKLLKKWRPISLLNVDYKICSKLIANRLAKVLSSIINEDQTCSLPGTTIFENLAMFRDILDHVNITNETGILVSLDQEKAFDRVDHTFLCRTLECFSFGPSFFAVDFHPIPWRVHENYSQWLFNRETFSEERSETG